MNQRRWTMKHYERVMTIEEFDRYTEEYNKVKYTCKCGRRVVIPYWRNKMLCSWCGNYVYRDKKDEFKERLENARKNYK